MTAFTNSRSESGMSARSASSTAALYASTLLDRISVPPAASAAMNDGQCSSSASMSSCHTVKSLATTVGSSKRNGIDPTTAVEVGSHSTTFSVWAL